MKPNAYRTLALNEEHGWYYEARRRAIARLIDDFVRSHEAGPREPLNVVDVGCGTGGTTEFLTNYGHVTGVEPSPLAIELLKQYHPDVSVVQGGVDELSKLLPAHEYDLATVLGVLYSSGVRDPLKGLESIRRALKPGGWLIWNEATYPFLKRQHDEFVNTARRFYPGEMRDLLIDAGFEVVYGSHLLAWGFPVAVGLAALYRIKQLFGLARRVADEQDETDDRPLPEWLNDLLMRTTYGEWSLGLSGVKMPVGVSYLVLARKPQANHGVSSATVRNAA
jgi:SAM-dependent methyltransferase